MRKKLPKTYSKNLKLNLQFAYNNDYFAIYGTHKGRSLTLVPSNGVWAIFCSNRRKCSGLKDKNTAIKVCDFLSTQDKL